MKHIVSFSTGLSSAITSVRVLEKYPDAELVFMDTQFEDEDNYRFMNDFENKFGVQITRIVEGRNPYEVFKKHNLIPNSRIAPCTYELKINIFRNYIKSISGEITIYIGYDYSEVHRCEAMTRNYGELGYSVDYPLLWKPLETRRYSDAIRHDWGIEPPRMYQLGYTHANCGGRCVKQGQGDWIRTMINFPSRFHDIEEWERDMRKNETNQDYAILKSQTAGEMKPLTLEELRIRYEKEHNDPILLDMESACVVCGIGG
jgi:hypothetical protein